MYRKNADGIFPLLEDIVQDISVDNFYLIIDETATLATSQTEVGKDMEGGERGSNIIIETSLGDADLLNNNIYPNNTNPKEPQVVHVQPHHLIKFQRNYRVNQSNSFFLF